MVRSGSLTEPVWAGGYKNVLKIQPLDWFILKITLSWTHQKLETDWEWKMLIIALYRSIFRGSNSGVSGSICFRSWHTIYLHLVKTAKNISPNAVRRLMTIADHELLVFTMEFLYLEILVLLHVYNITCGSSLNKLLLLVYLQGIPSRHIWSFIQDNVRWAQ